MARSKKNGVIDLYKKGIDRESLSLKDAEMVIMPFIMEENGGSMQQSQLVKKGLINYHLPFLPLQRKHVRNCILDAIEVFYTVHKDG